jgi:hypothetical protein
MATASDFLSLACDPLLEKVLYAEPHRIASDIAQDGSVSVNTLWEQGRGGQWYIEQQRYGGDLVEAGVCVGDEALVRKGVQILDWGFKHEAADGSFPETGDAFHSVSMFVEGAARALLLLQEKDRKKYADVINTDLPKLRLAAYWLLKPAVLAKGRNNDAPYTHRRWILAAALVETSALLHDRTLQLAAAEFASDGINLQTNIGVNPEKGGYDVSYQAVGLSMAERAYVLFDDQSLKERTLFVIRNGLNWLDTKIDRSGNVDIEGSTRVGKESGRSGKKKTFDIRAGLHALANGSTITGSQQYRQYAQALATARGWMR